MGILKRATMDRLAKNLTNAYWNEVGRLKELKSSQGVTEFTTEDVLHFHKIAWSHTLRTVFGRSSGFNPRTGEHVLEPGFRAAEMIQLQSLAMSCGFSMTDVEEPHRAPAPVPPSVPARMPPPAQWSPDPTGRHELRYWNGSEWTEHVTNGGVPGTDPLPRSSKPSA